MKEMVKRSQKCLICRNKKLVNYLDLGKQALVNSYIEKKDLKKRENKFSLKVSYFPECHLVQLTDIVDRNLLFKRYAYFTSSSEPLVKYFQEYAENVKKKFPKQSSGFVFEIASNDGILLRNFKKSKKILGIEPAKNIAKLANKEGIKTLPIFFNPKNVGGIIEKYGKADIIFANHVVAHTGDPHSLVAGVKKLLSNTGVFIFEVQYIGDLIKNNEFDNTYHEHACYFSLAPLSTLLSKYDLQIFDVEKVSAQGGSIRVYARHNNLNIKVQNIVKRLLEEEKKAKLHDIKTYKDFSKKPELIKKEIRELLLKFKKEGKKIAGYGAPAKGNTLLQFCDIDNKIIDYTIDTTPFKQNKYTPGTHIPIYDRDYMDKNMPDYILLLAWNYSDYILEKEKELRKKGVKFIKPIPKLEIL